MKKFSKFISLALILLIMSGLVFSAFAETNDLSGTTINVYNWGQYISDGTDGYIDVNKAFTEQTGIKVNYLTFDSNESLYTKLKTGGAEYDVIIPSDYMIHRLIDEGLVQKINFDNIPNYKYISDAYKNTAYDPTNEYSVPYTWGAVGIIYNDKFVDEADLGGWDLLWNDKYAGKILMFDNPRDSFGAAELYLGYSLNSEDEAEITAAADLLTKQKPLLQSYVMDQIYGQMTHEEAWIAPYYAGDYLQMSAENDHLKFFYPKEGFNLFIDACCIPTSSKNTAAAEAYINFLCDPEIMAENLSFLGYSAPSEEAKALMDPEVSGNEIAYPAEDVLARGEAFLNLSPESTKLMDSLWLKVKTDSSQSNENESGIYIGLAAAVGAIVVFFFVRSQAQRKKKAARESSKR